MSTVKAFIQRHPVSTYFALTFAISWGGFLGVVGPHGFPGTPGQLKTLMPIAVAVMIVGPSVAGPLLTGLAYGRAGLRELLSRLLKWRVSARWYASALLIAPTLMTAVLLVFSLFSPKFLPRIVVSDDKAGLLLSGLAIALGAGIFEELGWTGFAIPTLRLRYGVLGTGLIVGLPWAAWHSIVTLWQSGTASGSLSLVTYAVDPFFFLVAFRLLMVLVYERTGSLLVGILMHVSLTASAVILGASGIAGVSVFTFDLVWCAAVWVIILAIAVANSGHLSRTNALAPVGPRP